MTNFTYNRDKPDAPNNPSNDQAPMKVNTNSIDDLIAVDHFSFNDNLGGYHNVVHQNAQLVTPTAIPGPPQINQAFVQSVTPNTTGGAADTQLFNLTALNSLSQLTGFLVDKVAAVVGPPSYPDLFQGYQWLGGILVQWGYVKGTHGSDNHFNDSDTGSITFKDRVTGAIPFPNNCFFVMPASFFYRTSTASGEVTVSVNSATLSNLKFDWSLTTGSNKYTVFYWIAIGN